MALIEIHLPPGFTAKHERRIIDYLSDRLRGREALAYGVYCL